MGKILRELIEDLKEKDIKGRQDIDRVGSNSPEADAASKAGISNGVEVRGIACDSRKVEEGFLFVCIPGFNFDGHTFTPEAIKKGACALVVEKNIEPHEGVTVIKVPDTRYALSILATKFYDYPSKNLRLIGVAGTNGKTTITYLIRQILIEAGRKTALFGTIAYQLGDKILPAPWTTPPSLELQSMFKELAEDGFDSVVMEVTSHALTLDRVAGCEFALGVFNNLSRDHLDFHKTMEDYLEAEVKLFRLLNRSSKTRKRAIINIDDPYAEHIMRNTDVKILTYGIEQDADVKAYDISLSFEGLKFNVTTPLGKTAIHFQLPGKHNVYNALAAIAVGVSEGIGLDQIREAIAKVKNVPGRFERLNCGQPFSASAQGGCASGAKGGFIFGGNNIVVDYAHTPDALKNVLQTARELTNGKVIVVFGCGGDRDKTKRPLMGGVAAGLSDIVILTSDNPRSEDPLKIIKEIETGITPPAFLLASATHIARCGSRRKQEGGCHYLIIEDRFEAIKEALSLARDGDLVLIAGKGHEDEQIVKNKRISFNDKDVVKRLLGR